MSPEYPCMVWWLVDPPDIFDGAQHRRSMLHPTQIYMSSSLVCRSSFSLRPGLPAGF